MQKAARVRHPRAIASDLNARQEAKRAVSHHFPPRVRDRAQRGMMRGAAMEVGLKLRGRRLGQIFWPVATRAARERSNERSNAAIQEAARFAKSNEFLSRVFQNDHKRQMGGRWNLWKQHAKNTATMFHASSDPFFVARDLWNLLRFNRILARNNVNGSWHGEHATED